MSNKLGSIPLTTQKVYRPIDSLPNPEGDLKVRIAVVSSLFDRPKILRQKKVSKEKLRYTFPKKTYQQWIWVDEASEKVIVDLPNDSKFFIGSVS